MINLVQGRRTLWGKVLLGILLVVPFLAHADAPESAFVSAKAQFEQGRLGEAKANDRAQEQFRALLEQEPGNPLFLAYYGSSFTIQGREAWAPWNKVKYTERGLELIDKAVRLLKPIHDSLAMRGIPVSIETLLVAASTFLGVPDRFNRFESGKAAVTTAFSKPAFANAPASVQAQFYYQASLVARKDGKSKDETQALREALARCSDSPIAGEARQRLKDLGE